MKYKIWKHIKISLFVYIDSFILTTILKSNHNSFLWLKYHEYAHKNKNSDVSLYSHLYSTSNSYQSEYITSSQNKKQLVMNIFEILKKYLFYFYRYKSTSDDKYF